MATPTLLHLCLLCGPQLLPKVMTGMATGWGPDNWFFFYVLIILQVYATEIYFSRQIKVKHNKLIKINDFLCSHSLLTHVNTFILTAQSCEFFLAKIHQIWPPILVSKQLRKKWSLIFKRNWNSFEMKQLDSLLGHR